METPTHIESDGSLDFATDIMFDRVFEEGMQLVDEAARYLDGPGRRKDLGLSRPDSLTFAAWSMELTSRLMQAASWLVMQRSVQRGDMTRNEALNPKYRLERDSASMEATHPDVMNLPIVFLDLVERCETLFERIMRLDMALYTEKAIESLGTGPANERLAALQLAAASGRLGANFIKLK